MTAPNHYRVLGVGAGASAAELRAAYARLVKLHHPDVAGRLPARLREVQQAYRCLADPAARAAHDRQLGEEERRHVARQRRLQRRIRRYDRRHPPPRPRWWRRWRTVLVCGGGAGLVALAGVAIGLLGDLS